MRVYSPSDGRLAVATTSRRPDPTPHRAGLRLKPRLRSDPPVVLLRAPKLAKTHGCFGARGRRCDCLGQAAPLGDLRHSGSTRRAAGTRLSRIIPSRSPSIIRARARDQCDHWCPQSWAPAREGWGPRRRHRCERRSGTSRSGLGRVRGQTAGDRVGVAARVRTAVHRRPLSAFGATVTGAEAETASLIGGAAREGVTLAIGERLRHVLRMGRKSALPCARRGESVTHSVPRTNEAETP
jgi:hypothetical protein